MRVAVTGAGGFIGRYVVEHAVAAGHEVVAIARSTTPSSWADISSIDIRISDLSDSNALKNDLDLCDCVIHLAADMSSSTAAEDSTLTATRNLIAAMQGDRTSYLILVSSIAILDYLQFSPEFQIDETAPISTQPSTLGGYAQMKLAQERMCLDWAEQSGNQLAIVRPGLVYDSYALSTAHVGLAVKNIALAAAHSGRVPVVHAEDLASALLLAASQPLKDEVIHIVGDSLQSQADYLGVLKQREELKFIFSINWRIYAAMAATVRTLLGGENSAWVPDSFRRSSVKARMTPYTFSNRKAQRKLQWQPRYTRNFLSEPNFRREEHIG